MPDVNNPGGTPDSGANGVGGTPNPEAKSMPASFEEWLKGQDENVKALYENHTKGLRTALDNERTGRAEQSKQLKDLAKKAEKGSEAEKLLEDAVQRLEAADRRADFMADAIKPEIGCSNARAAYALAMAENLFDAKGNADWAAIRAAAPELFVKKAPVSNAGAGTAQVSSPQAGMNSFIRRSTGRE